MTTGLQRAETQAPGLGDVELRGTVLPLEVDDAQVLPFPHVTTTPRSVTWRRRLRAVVRLPRTRGRPDVARRPDVGGGAPRRPAGACPRRARPRDAPRRDPARVLIAGIVGAR